jgi:hypothetical protein
MAKLTAWIVTIIGLLLVWGQITALPQIPALYVNWLVALGVLVVGIGKLVRNYSKK